MTLHLPHQQQYYSDVIVRVMLQIGIVYFSVMNAVSFDPNVYLIHCASGQVNTVHPPCCWEAPYFHHVWHSDFTVMWSTITYDILIIFNDLIRQQFNRRHPETTSNTYAVRLSENIFQYNNATLHFSHVSFSSLFARYFSVLKMFETWSTTCFNHTKIYLI